MNRLLLIGAGHAHLHVLRALAAQSLPDTQVTLVSPWPTQIYSGMLPGWIAGHYSLDHFSIPVAPLAAAADAVFVPASVTALDLDARRATTSEGESIAFDFVSLDIGPTLAGDMPGLRTFALAIRPMHVFVDRFPLLHERLAATAAQRPATLTVIGGGAGGVELALAIAYRARTQRMRLQATLVTGRDGLLPALPAGARTRIARHLRAADVGVRETDAVAVEQDAVLLDGGTRLASDAAIAATGAAAAAWPRTSGLAVDAEGYIEVDETLRSTSHPFVFAAGDCASMRGHPRAKSGVFAVRAGPPLAANLYRAVTGTLPKRWRPQRRALYLLSTGAWHAIAVWGELAFEGRTVWRWKDRIDRAFVARYVTQYDR